MLLEKSGSAFSVKPLDFWWILWYTIGKKYSERVYCKTLPFGDECLGNNGNAVGVTEKYRAYMMAPERVIRIKATDWEVADDDEAL